MTTPNGQNRFNLNHLNECRLPEAALEQLKTLEKERKQNPLYSYKPEMAPFRGKIRDKEQLYFKEVLAAFNSPSQGFVHSVSSYAIENEFKALMVQAAGGWVIRTGHQILGAVMPKNISLNSKGEQIHCYWDSRNRYDLLLWWGFNPCYFFGESQEWGHPNKSYRILDLTRDEVLTIKALAENGFLVDNYWDLQSQLEEALETGELTPSWEWGEE